MTNQKAPPKVPFFVAPYFRDGLGGPRRKRKPPTRYVPPTDIELARFVAWMLVIDPKVVWEGGPTKGNKADARLVAYIRALLDELREQAERTPHPERGTLEGVADSNSRKTLRYCRAVMGRHLPPMRNTGGGYVPVGSERSYTRGVSFPASAKAGTK